MNFLYEFVWFEQLPFIFFSCSQIFSTKKVISSAFEQKFFGLGPPEGSQVLPIALSIKSSMFGHPLM